jgi:adenosine deaminase
MGSEKSVTLQTLAALRDKLLAAGLRNEVAVDEKDLGVALSARAALEHCNGGGAASPACGVRIHFLYQVLRGNLPQQVFAQTLLGFEVATVDHDVVGINFVMPEDGEISMRDYHLQMQMLDYLHGVYPRVHISLHAGELAPGLVPPEGLAFHIREAVELGHAERIGHGVDVLYEDHARDLLQEMAARHIDVEVNLTSNDGILNVKGGDHPLAAYMAAHVPFSLSTDDEGVSRIDLTHEYARAAEEQDLSYVDLKHSARDSLEHSFLPGESLWHWQDNYDHRKPVCSAAINADSKPYDACRQLLDGSEKAAEQWELERRLAEFETNVRWQPVH